MLNYGVNVVGAAVGVELDDVEAKVCQVDDIKDILTPLATAYARARGKCDNISKQMFNSKHDNLSKHKFRSKCDNMSKHKLCTSSK